MSGVKRHLSLSPTCETRSTANPIAFRRASIERDFKVRILFVLQLLTSLFLFTPLFRVSLPTRLTLRVRSAVEPQRAVVDFVELQSR